MVKKNRYYKYVNNFVLIWCHDISDGTSELSTEKLVSNSPQKSDSGIQVNIQSENAQVDVETATTLENSYLGLTGLNSLILLCYESELSLHSLKFVIKVPLFMSIIIQILIYSFLPVNEIT